ncbi:unnamed protein product [Chondrus crispus]|uniref:Protein kinase domain-containing protein n=1 Tax=Chondrus crispus TaxID=2769 RepID=R7Q409_CHOCR|nr:unnamed protein product [Chondrus crispus]CDF33267.1 unnamed protein product [Chondrus crispus]|eukprot:XP_005713070.1 unnamed protein product [Chondrus crispus]
MKILDKVEFRDECNQFQASYVTFHDGENYYKAQSSVLVPEKIDECNVATLSSVLIPQHHIFPLYDHNLSVSQSHIVETGYVKIPTLFHYNANEPDKIPARLLCEAQVLEALSKSPHPNVVRYMGCVVKENRVVGLCLERCVETLYQRTWLKREKVDNMKVVDSVRRGVSHLHQLGYCHNDISLENIMFREDDSITIVDFDSCQRTGDRLGSKKGTPGFCDEAATMSRPENDFYSLGKVEAYLRTGKLFP